MPSAPTRPFDASGLEPTAEALTVPFRPAMGVRRLAVTGGGALAVTTDSREPLLLVRLRRALADEAVVVTGKVGTSTLPPIVFAPYSESGSHLPIYRPALVGSTIAGPFTVTIQVRQVSGAAAFAAVPSGGTLLTAAQAADAVEGVLLEGRLARVLCLQGLETQRVLRQAREIQAMRHLDLARGRALDDHGAGLGVPRFRDVEESDDHYRARLRLYSRWRLPTPAGLREALNGPGAPADPNQGLPSQVGVTARFNVVEDINDLAVAFKVVGVGMGGGAKRDRFHEILRQVYLFDLTLPPSAALPAARRARLEAIRTTLGAELTLMGTGPAKPRYMAVRTAAALERAVKLVRRLGYTGQIRLVKAYDHSADSRFELGLGCALTRFTAPQLTQMVGKVATAAAGHDEIALVAQGLQPRPAAQDPLGKWLLEPCGFRTVHPLSGTQVYLSPLPAHGLRIEGPSQVSGGMADYVAKYEGGTTGGLHVRAEEALAGLAAEFARRGLTPVPVPLTPAELSARLTALAGLPASPPPAEVAPLVAAGLVPGGPVAPYATLLLSAANLDEVAAFGFAPAELTAMASGSTVTEAMSARVDALFDAGFYSARGVWDAGAGRLLLLASVSQLPGAPSHPGAIPSSGFLWYETEIPAVAPGTQGRPPLAIAVRYGAKMRAGVNRAGLTLLAAVAYARRGLADPYEIRIDLPESPTSPLLNRDQYEYLMNLLEFLHPIGIEINTFDLRKRHVDADGDNKPEWLTSRASRTYHRYRQRRPFDFPGGRPQDQS